MTRVRWKRSEVGPNGVIGEESHVVGGELTPQEMARLRAQHLHPIMSAETAPPDVPGPGHLGASNVKADEPETAADVVEVINWAMKRLNDVIAAAEKKFAQKNLGVEAVVLFNDANEEGWTSFLRFGKHDKEWRLFVGSSFMHDEPEPEEWTLLANAS